MVDARARCIYRRRASRRHRRLRAVHAASGMLAFTARPRRPNVRFAKAVRRCAAEVPRLLSPNLERPAAADRTIASTLGPPRVRRLRWRRSACPLDGSRTASIRGGGVRPTGSHLAISATLAKARSRPAFVVARVRRRCAYRAPSVFSTAAVVCEWLLQTGPGTVRQLAAQPQTRLVMAEPCRWTMAPARSGSSTIMVGSVRSG